MSRLPWLVLPLLFLPNLGFLRKTGFGNLEINDFLVWPYIAAAAFVLLARRSSLRPSSLTGRQLFGIVLFFFSWTFLSTLTVAYRYPYPGNFELVFGLLKLAKMATYFLAGWLTTLLVRDERSLARFLWSLTVGGLLTAVALPFIPEGLDRWDRNAVQGFKTTNAVSVEVAILIAFLGVAWASGWGRGKWRLLAPWALGAMTFGLAFSRGRGGWLAALVGLLWFLYRRGLLRRKALALAVILAGVAVLAYQRVPEFRREVDRTINPDSKYLSTYDAGFMGFDEGGRRKYWRMEGAKIIEAPVLGRGLFNRFPGSGLRWEGSHSFWLQMFLETGIPGGTAVLVIMWMLWRESRRRGTLPVEVALLVAFVGGLGGEYFYGGMSLLVLTVVAGVPFRLRAAAAATVRQPWTKSTSFNGQDPAGRLTALRQSTRGFVPIRRS